MNIIATMLRENTGANFLDSGSAYGRHHERNQGRSFESEPEATADFKYDVEVTINVYHFLKSRVTLAANLDRQFKRFSDREENRNDGWLAISDAWLKHLSSKGREISGLYGEGSPMVVNTYNGEDLLSQVLQFTLFRMDHTDYVLLQVHGGCDVRGGYTRPRVMEVNGDACNMFDNARASIYCTGDQDKCGAYWDTENGCSWHREGNYGGTGAQTQLDKYDRTAEEKGETWEAGKLHVLADRSALCPCCGSPLKPAMFPGG